MLTHFGYVMLSDACTRAALLLFVLIFGSNGLAAGQPTDNPVDARYPGAYPWTDEIRWERVFSVADYEDRLVDVTDNRGNTRSDYHAAISAAQDAAVEAGGGIVFFPAGTYYVSRDLDILDRIVLRGADPVNPRDARDDDYLPPSRLEFPEYVPTFTGSGTPTTTAFKEITSSGGGNVGLVNLDIDRAEIRFSESRSNVVFFSLRSNNAATPGFSSANEPPESWMAGWQRFPHRFSHNLSAGASENLLVANSRFNDAPTDNYEQTGYVVEWRGQSGSEFPSGASVALGIDIGPPFVFDYTAHYTVSASADEGLVIRDNWMYGTRRVKIYFDGNGAVVKGNVLRDEPDKFAWVGATGKKTAWGGETLENRGIDLAGYDVLIEDNDIEIYPHETFGGYSTTDGEGILLQEVGGNPVQRAVDGLTIRDNRVNQYIGIYKVGNVRDLLIENNTIDGHSAQLGGTLIYVNADRNDDPNYSAEAVRILGNSLPEGGSILLRAGMGGAENEIVGNVSGGDDSEIVLDGPDGAGRDPLSVVVANNQGFSIEQEGLVAMSSRATGSSGFRVLDVHPNPLSETGTIRFDLSSPADVVLDLFDVLGRRVFTAQVDALGAGPNREVGIDTAGLAAGVYLYHLRARSAAGDEIGTGKLIVVH